MFRRDGTTLIELIIVMLISIIFLSAVYMGIDVVVQSLKYSKEVILKMYHQNQIEISLEIINKEIQNAGSMVSVVRNLDTFKTKTGDGNLSRGILSETGNEFYVQYGVTYNFALKDTESGTYVKIIKSAPEPPTISYDSKFFWQALTSEGFKESSAKTINLLEASLTNLSNHRYSVTGDVDTFVFFVYTPELLDKVLLINSKPYFGEQVAQSVFTYADKTLKMSKYLPFVDETIEAILLKNLESFEFFFGINESTDISYKDADYLSENPIYWENLRTLKISFTTKIPESEEMIETEKIFWLPESDVEGGN